jgi:dolichyl-phosphate-mannose--protein O-mannosyl transferase
MLGLGTATKWFGVIPWAMCLGLIIFVRLLQNWGVRFANYSSTDWYQRDLWRGVKTTDFLLYFVAVPLLVYYSTFFPALLQKENAHSLWDILFDAQARMWDGQGRVVDSHPYMSSWTGWALLKRPIWYAFDKEGTADESVRGVLLLGNPLMMWGGLVALTYCFKDWLNERRRDAMLIAVTYLAFYFSWAVIPRKVAFYYYYYPAGMTLSLAITYVFHRLKDSKLASTASIAQACFLGAAMGLFIYFFPILAALKIPANSYVKYTWFQSWI